LALNNNHSLTHSITFIFYYRCRLLDVQDDGFSTLSTELETSNVSIYNASQCYLTTNETAIPCNEWVYDSSVYTSTLISKVSIIFFQLLIYVLRESREHCLS